MDTDIFCLLCGGPFALEQHVYNIDPDKECFQWLYHVRLLGTSSALRHHRMTTDGELHTNFSGNDDIFLSETLQWKITDSDCFRLGESFYHVLTKDEAGDALFPLHEACIEIASKVIMSQETPQSESNNDSALKSLYQNLKGKLQAGDPESQVRQDVFGLRSVCTSSGPRSVLAFGEMDWWDGLYEKYFTNPLWVPNLTPAIFTMLQPLSQPYHGNNAMEELTRPPHLIEALPNELMDRITNMLPPQSLMSLRQCSRTMAQKIPLDDRFWRKHICDASLLPYLWDIDAEQFKRLHLSTAGEHPVDWKGLIRHLVSPAQTRSNQIPSSYPELPQGLWNRRRIWSIVADGLFNADRREYGPSKCSKNQHTDSKLEFNYCNASMILGLTIILTMALAWDLGCWET